jgi:hypothetical protein
MLGGFIIPYKKNRSFYKKSKSFRNKRTRNKKNIFSKRKSQKTRKRKTIPTKTRTKKIVGGSDCNNGLQFTGKSDAIGMARYH